MSDNLGFLDKNGQKSAPKMEKHEPYQAKLWFFMFFYSYFRSILVKVKIPLVGSNFGSSFGQISIQF